MSSFFSMEVSGFDSAIKHLTQLGNAEKELIPIMENSYKRYQLSAFRRAPVDTGLLSSTLMDDRYSTMKYADGDYEITQREGVEGDGAHYILLQEFTNPNGKTRFIRDSVIEEQPKLENELIKLLERMS